MKTEFLNFVALGFALVVAVSGCSSEDGSDSSGRDIPDSVIDLPKLELTSAERAIAERETEFQVNLFADVLASEIEKGSDEKNYSFSPVNASLALSMMANATDAATAAKLCDILGQSDLEGVNMFNARLMDYLPVQPDGDKLVLANGVWYRNDFYMRPEFLADVTKVFGTDPMGVTSLTSASYFIDHWIREKTEGLICPNLNPAMIPEQAVMYIASALYYKGQWAMSFNPGDTRNREFHGTDGTVKVPMMYKSAGYNYNIDNEGTQIVEIPFRSKRMVLSVILPSDDADIEQYAISFNNDKFETLRSGLTRKTVSLFLPKFEMRNHWNLNDYLISRDINPFDFSLERAFQEDDMFINLMQDTYFKIDEEGVRLAAVTSGDMTLSSDFSNTVMMSVDRPFIYFVHEKDAGTMLMCGLVRSLK